MDKRPFRKSNRKNGDKRERIGISLGIHDKNGIELKSGDKIIYYGVECIILWNKYSEEYEAMMLYSNWYHSREEYCSDSYGKSYSIPMDDGARMIIEKI